VAQFGVARMTVRQAVESLVAEGRLFKVAGKGTFVARPKVDLQARLTSFGEESDETIVIDEPESEPAGAPAS